MKTLLISEIFPPKTGGSGRWFFEIYSRLPRNEYIIAAGIVDKAREYDSQHNLRIVRWPLTITKWGIIHPRRLIHYIYLFYRLYLIVRRERIKVIHCGRGLPEGLLGWFAWKWKKIPYICYVHGEELHIFKKSKELIWLSQVVYSEARSIIVNSKNTRKLLLEYIPSLYENKICILHPGVDTKYFRPSPMDIDIRKKLGWNDRVVVLTVGRLQKRKGHDNTILALQEIKEKIPNILYAIVGDGEEHEYLMHLTMKKGLQDYVQFLGDVDEKTLRYCYQQCDLFVLANREVDGDFEGFGMVLIEAQSCGKLVITGNSGGTAETLVPGKTGLIVDCRVPDLITGAVIQLLINNKKRKTMEQTAIKWVHDNFDWESSTLKAEKLFHKTD